MKHKKFTTGLTLHTPDYDRDILFGEMLESVAVPNEFEIKDLIPDYQDGVPKCVMESFSYLSRLQNYYETNIDVNLSADAGYLIAKSYYDKNRDYGTSLLTGAKVAVEWGFPEDTIFLDNEEYWNDPNIYFDLSRITESIKDNASIYRSQTYVRNSGIGWGNVNEEELKQMIYQRYGAVIAIGGDKNFYGNGDGFIKPPLSITWQHGIVVKGWKMFNNTLHFKIANWWDNTKTGNTNGSGFGWLNWNIWKPFIWGAYSMVNAPNDSFQKIKMWKLIQVQGDGKIFLEFLGEHYWIDDMKKVEQGILDKHFTSVQVVDSLYPLKIVGKWYKFPFLKNNEFLKINK